MLRRLSEVAMPFPHDTLSPPHPYLGGETLPLRGLTLLAVEDSRFACDALRLICIRSGARLRRAETLAAARAYLAAHRPDVVIVDLGLPDGRGEGLIADLACTGMPVLATSGDPEGRHSSLAAGAAAFLDKPIGSIAGFQRLILDLVGYGDARPRTDPTAHSAPPADELAFRDDLAHASTLIGGADIGYATGFLRSLGRSAGDQALEEAALAAATGPGRDALARLVAARLAQPQRVS
jgi:CheY-like chemotaxis protein